MTAPATRLAVSSTHRPNVAVVKGTYRKAVAVYDRS
jgi:hypothetical protein